MNRFKLFKYIIERICINSVIPAILFLKQGVFVEYSGSIYSILVFFQKIDIMIYSCIHFSSYISFVFFLETHYI